MGYIDLYKYHLRRLHVGGTITTSIAFERPSDLSSYMLGEQLGKPVWTRIPDRTVDGYVKIEDLFAMRHQVFEYMIPISQLDSLLSCMEKGTSILSCTIFENIDVSRWRYESFNPHL